MVNNLFSQRKLDSLIKSLPTIANDEDKAKTLNTICLQMVYSYPDSALVYGQMSLEIGRETKNNRLKGKAFNRIGIVYDVINKWDSALIYYDSALVHAEIAKDSITIASAYNNIGLIYWNKSLYNKAIDNFFKSLKLFEILGKEKGVANTYNNIGLIFMEQGRSKESLKYNLQSLKIREKLHDEYGINDSKLNIALQYYDLIKYDSSSFYFESIIPFYQENENHYALGTVYNDLGMLRKEEQDLQSSLDFFKKAIEEHMSVKNYYKAASSLYNLSTVYKELNKTQKELEVLLRAQKLLDDESSLRVRCKVLFQLADVYSDMKQYKLSNSYFMEFKILKDSLQIIERDEAIEIIKVEYETEKKEKALEDELIKNELLQKENALAESQISNRNKWLIAVISSSLTVLFFLLFLNQQNKRRVQAEKDKAIIKEREKGLTAVFNAQEKERERIAKDLHDGIGQQLSAIKLYFDFIAKRINKAQPELHEKTERIYKLIIDTANDVRSISHQMMPKTLTEMGLVLAIEDLLESSFSNTKVKYSFEVHGLDQRLPSTIEIALYRIAQELFTNIIKHSGAGKLDVQLMRMKKYCMLIVHDDGIGISSEKSDGIGMLNMNSRLRTINGDLDLKSKEGEGTTATIRIALK